MADEIELKLTLDEADAGRLGRTVTVKVHATGRPQTRRLVSTYFDTADGRLRRAGVALRVRQIGRSRYLTVKAGEAGLGGVLVRREWEGRIAGEAPDLLVVTDPELRRAVETAAAGAPFVAMFTTKMSRTSRALDLGDGTTATLDLDRGTVVAAGSEETVCELEIELRSGDPVRLFAFARELLAELPFRVSTETKAARGFRLLDGSPPAWVKARPLTFDPAYSVEDALVVTLQNCLDQVLANAPAVLANDHPEGVHQMRVGLRRLRSALTLFRSVLPEEQRAALADEVRWLTNELGPARDADVQADEIVGPVCERMGAGPAWKRLSESLAADRTAGRAAARRAVGDVRTTRLQLAFSDWLVRRAWREQPVSDTSARLFRPLLELSSELLARRHAKCRRRAKAFADLPDVERHELRKDLKKLRYACEFFRTLYGKKRVGAYAQRLAALQDCLGYLNDVAVAREYVAGLLARAEDGGADLAYVAGAVLGWHERALAEQEPATAARVRAFLAAQPFWAARR